MARAGPGESRYAGDLRLRYPAVPDSVPALRSTLARLAHELRFPPRTIEAIQLAVSEAASNVVLHAYRPPREPGTLDVTATYRNKALTITVSDSGSGAQPASDSPGLGIGLLLIDKMADAAQFRRSQTGGMSVQMRFDG